MRFGPDLIADPEHKSKGDVSLCTSPGRTKGLQMLDLPAVGQSLPQEPIGGDGRHCEDIDHREA
jgi:hypothetical protein